jgi:glycosidase
VRPHGPPSGRANRGEELPDLVLQPVTFSQQRLRRATIARGIPCIYYGSEQKFDGSGSGPGNDRYIREAMFGGSFGAFRSHGRHFFDESAPVHGELSRVLAVRRAEPALRRGRQFLRQISGNGTDFGYPASSGGAPFTVMT